VPHVQPFEKYAAQGGAEEAAAVEELVLLLSLTFEGAPRSLVASGESQAAAERAPPRGADYALSIPSGAEPSQGAFAYCPCPPGAVKRP
jgi:hypothetical protein